MKNSRRWTPYALTGMVVVLVALYVGRSRTTPTLEPHPIRRTSPEPSPRPQEVLVVGKEGTSSVLKSPGRLEAGEVPRILERLFAKHKSADKDSYTAPIPRFAREKALSLREGRLLALAFPDTMAPLLNATLTDPSKDPLDRYYAIQLLGVLAASGNRAAETFLDQAAHDRDTEISGLAVKQLYPMDQQGAYRTLYLDKCGAEDTYGFDALAYWADSGNAALMKRYMAEDRETSLRPVLAEKVVKCYGILFSNDWSMKLESILKNPDADDFSLTPWAIQMAKRRSLTSFQGALRERLQKGMTAARSQAQSLAKKMPSLSMDESRFLDQYSATPMDHVISDVYHDDALIALAESGGELTIAEKRRLRTFGYAGDPNDRLVELMAADR
jgi:hypothetical protein